MKISAILMLPLLLATSPVAAQEVPGGPARDPAAVPPLAWASQDPADALYREARGALNRGEFGRAADGFRDIYVRHPRSTYAPDAPYWEAFARQRLGGEAELRAAIAALELQRARYPTASTRRDADALAMRIQGALAERGDRAAYQELMRGAAPRAPVPSGATAPEHPCHSAEVAVRAGALATLARIDPGEAVAALREILRPENECPAPIQSAAIFGLGRYAPVAELIPLYDGIAHPPLRALVVSMLAQHLGDPRVFDKLAEIARTDPDPHVRTQAIFQLSESNDPRLREILRDVLRP